MALSFLLAKRKSRCRCCPSVSLLASITFLIADSSFKLLSQHQLPSHGFASARPCYLYLLSLPFLFLLLCPTSGLCLRGLKKSVAKVGSCHSFVARSSLSVHRQNLHTPLRLEVVFGRETLREEPRHLMGQQISIMPVSSERLSEGKINF